MSIACVIAERVDNRGQALLRRCLRTPGDSDRAGYRHASCANDGSFRPLLCVPMLIAFHVMRGETLTGTLRKLFVHCCLLL